MLLWDNHILNMYILTFSTKFSIIIPAVREKLEGEIAADLIPRFHFEVIQVDDVSPTIAITSALLYTVDSDGKPDKLMSK